MGRHRRTMPRMYGPGMWAAKKLGKVLTALELTAALHVALAGYALKEADAAAKAWTTTWFWAATGLGVVIAYVARSKTEVERDEAKRQKQAKEAAEQRALDVLSWCKQQTAGNLGEVLRAMVGGSVKSYREYQVDFLSLAVEVLADALKLDRRDMTLAANWGVPRPGFQEWEVVAYDRHRTSRHAGKRRPISPEAAGASQALLSGRITFIPDIRADSIKQWFDVDAPYRSILSIPAAAWGVTSGGNRCMNSLEVCADDHPHTDAIVGVLNIDCGEPTVLTKAHADLLYDFALIIAILERLGEPHGQRLDAEVHR